MAKEKPNIILILTDDLGYGDLSCFNPDSKIRTEHIDAVAAEGLRNTDCHASSALCTPSRYGLLTGRYNWRSRLKRGVLPGQSSPLIEEGRETIGSFLQKQGYRTACVGKWHLGMNWTVKDDYTLPETYEDPNGDQDKCAAGIDFTAPIADGPNTRGFDYFFGLPASLDQPPFVYIENDHVLTPPDHMIGVRRLDRVGPSQQTEVEYGPAASGHDPAKVVPDMDAKVLSLVDDYAGKDQPFFIYYPTPAVHGPLLPAPEYQEKSGIGRYGDFVLQVDGFVGKLDEKLHEKGIADDTILIFTSDNGCSGIADYPTLKELGHNPSYIYRGKKSDIWEGGHRIPFIVRWPGHVPAGAERDQMTCLTDVFATIAEITGFTYGDDAGEDSFSALSVWEGGTEPIREDVMHHSVANYSLRRGKWKLEFCPGSGGMGPEAKIPASGIPGDDTPYQLYDLATDIREQNNLYGLRPEIEEELTRLAASYVKNGRTTPGKPQKNTECENWPGLEWMP
ncbi:MAG: arylsulfatase [Lachnospiraceae bacterium]|nr:arylsulfatase [Lachnospiraceae bacterium]